MEFAQTSRGHSRCTSTAEIKLCLRRTVSKHTATQSSSVNLNCLSIFHYAFHSTCEKIKTDNCPADSVRHSSVRTATRHYCRGGGLDSLCGGFHTWFARHDKAVKEICRFSASLIVYISGSKYLLSELILQFASFFHHGRFVGRLVASRSFFLGGERDVKLVTRSVYARGISGCVARGVMIANRPVKPPLCLDRGRVLQTQNERLGSLIHSWRILFEKSCRAHSALK